jgi:phospholipid-translocating ATPase
MLTGDKLETAENIGESCKLLHNENMKRIKLSNVADVEKYCSKEQVKENNERLSRGEMLGLLVEAHALGLILGNSDYKAMFLRISKTAEAVICCRVSPS